jgi:hypothetical protein
MQNETPQHQSAEGRAGYRRSDAGNDLAYVLRAHNGDRLLVETQRGSCAPSLRISGPRGGTRAFVALSIPELDGLIAALGAARAEAIAGRPDLFPATKSRIELRAE